jgi:hypothetical protein
MISVATQSLALCWLLGVIAGFVIAATVAYRRSATRLLTARQTIEGLRADLHRLQTEATMLAARLSLAPGYRADIEAKMDVIAELRRRLPSRRS